MPLVNTDKIKNPVNIEQTKESKQSLQLERRLLIDLNTILDFIKDNFDFKSHDYIRQLQIVREITYNQTYSIIRYYYQKAYELGTDYVNEILVSSPFLTTNDINNIEIKAQDYTNRFYGRFLKVLKKGNKEFVASLFEPRWNITNPNAITNDEAQIEMFAKQLEKSSTYLYTSLSVAIITEALNTAVINKGKKLLNPTLKAPPITLQAGEATNKILKEALEEELALREENRAEALRARGFFVIPLPDNTNQKEQKPSKQKVKQVDTSKMVYKWFTKEDERVCLQCSLLDGQEFRPSESIPKPKDDTHYNCRCRIVLVSGSEITVE